MTRARLRVQFYDWDGCTAAEMEESSATHDVVATLIEDADGMQTWTIEGTRAAIEGMLLEWNLDDEPDWTDLGD